MKKNRFNLFPLVLILMMLLGSFLPEGWAGQVAPNFSETDLQGKQHSLAQYREEILVLYFWASWCPTCRAEVSHMIQAYNEYHPKGVQFLSVSLDQNHSHLQDFVSEHHIPYPVIFGGKKWDTPLAQLYEVEGIPEFVIIGKDGQEYYRGSPTSQLKKKLKKLLKA